MQPHSIQQHVFVSTQM